MVLIWLHDDKFENELYHIYQSKLLLQVVQKVLRLVDEAPARAVGLSVVVVITVFLWLSVIHGTRLSWLQVRLSCSSSV